MALSNNEKWRQIKDFPDYQVSNKGRVKSNKTEKLIHSKKCRGYDRVSIYNNGYRSDKLVHRLVAEAFIDNPLNKNEVNHIDGNKQNNTAINLEWCTRSENMKHAFDNDLKKPSGGLIKKKLKVIETGKIYDSAYSCARDMILDQGHVNQCLTGKRKTHKGYHFEYI